jgi:uncharacterized membrane protein
LTWGDVVPDIIEKLVIAYPNQLFEKLGIFVDIARLSIILIQLKNIESPHRAVKIVRISLAFASVTLLVLTGLIYFCYICIDNINFDSDLYLQQSS